DPALVRARQRPRERAPERERLRHGQRTAPEPRAERPAAHEGHREPRARGRVAPLEDGHEAIEGRDLRRDALLALEAAGRVRRGREELERARRAIGRAHEVDDRGAAAPELLEHLVGPDPHGRSATKLAIAATTAESAR